MFQTRTVPFPKEMRTKLLEEAFGLLNGGKPAEALEKFKNLEKIYKANNLHPTNIQINQARCHLEMKKYGEAKKCLAAIDDKKFDFFPPGVQRDYCLTYDRYYKSLFREVDHKIENLKKAKKMLERIPDSFKETPGVKNAFAFWDFLNEGVYSPEVGDEKDKQQDSVDDLIGKIQNEKLTDQEIQRMLDAAKEEKRSRHKMKILKVLNNKCPKFRGLLETLEKAVEDVPDEYSQLTLANCYGKNGRDIEARRLFEKLINANSSFWKAKIQYAGYLQSIECFEESIPILESITKFDLSKSGSPPTIILSKAHGSLACAYRNLGDRQLAALHDERKLELKPNDAPTLSNQGKEMPGTMKRGRRVPTANKLDKLQQSRHANPLRWARLHGGTAIPVPLIPEDEIKQVATPELKMPAQSKKKKRKRKTKKSGELHSAKVQEVPKKEEVKAEQQKPSDLAPVPKEKVTTITFQPMPEIPDLVDPLSAVPVIPRPRESYCRKFGMFAVSVARILHLRSGAVSSCSHNAPSLSG